jgi:YD repeat-containing protein
MTTPGVSGLKQTFTYDALNRLATATEKNSGGTTTWSETYGYDIYGNRWVSATTPTGLETAFTPTASSNFNSSNRLLNNGALYDLSGNQTTIGGYTNTFDAESRLATSTLNSITATYSYDGEGRRVQETTGLATALGWLAIMLAARPSVQDLCKTPRKTRRYRMDHGLRRALKTQPLSTRRYPLEPPFSGSSPVAPTTRLFRNIRRPVCYLTPRMAGDDSQSQNPKNHPAGISSSKLSE